MPTAPLIYATTPYDDLARTIVCPPTLLRGSELLLFARALPAVEDGDLTLDLSAVKQVDAAGLGALVVLRQCAEQAGHSLRLLNPSPRVCELLKLTRLDSVFTNTECEMAGA